MRLITTLLDRSYRFLKRKHPSILWIGDETRREIALTFDDGPHPLHTPPVLDTLKRHGIHASFFLLGTYVEKYPQIVKQIHQERHEIGMHGYRHIPFPMEKPATIHKQLQVTSNLIAKICDLPLEAIKHIRPPYGAFNRETLSLLESLAYDVIMWNNIPPHWMQPLHWSIQQTIDQATPGGVIVLHDGHGHGTKVAALLDVVVPKLKSQGYKFVTVEEMQRKNANES